MKQNNEEQLEPRTKSSFSNIFPVTSFDDHDSPEEQLKKLVQLGEWVISYRIIFKHIFLAESLLESTDGLSPLTLEMVQSALIGLKQKKSVQNSQKKMRVIQQQQRKPAMRTSTQQQLKQPRNYFPDLDFISVKGKAPLLMPHPGDHMTPMTDDAVIKQNKLRKLRHEMIQVRVWGNFWAFD